MLFFVIEQGFFMIVQPGCMLRLKFLHAAFMSFLLLGKPAEELRGSRRKRIVFCRKPFNNALYTV